MTNQPYFYHCRYIITSQKPTEWSNFSLIKIHTTLANRSLRLRNEYGPPHPTSVFVMGTGVLATWWTDTRWHRPVGDVETPVHSALQRGEHTGPGAGALQPYVQVTAERVRPLLHGLHVELLARHFSGAFVRLVQAQFLQETTCEQQSRTVGRGIIGQPNLDSVPGELVAVCRAHDLVSLNAGVGNLQVKEKKHIKPTPNQEE